jgi:hypothetical protein
LSKNIQNDVCHSFFNINNIIFSHFNITLQKSSELKISASMIITRKRLFLSNNNDQIIPQIIRTKPVIIKWSFKIENIFAFDIFMPLLIFVKCNSKCWLKTSGTSNIIYSIFSYYSFYAWFEFSFKNLIDCKMSSKNDFY